MTPLCRLLVLIMTDLVVYASAELHNGRYSFEDLSLIRNSCCEETIEIVLQYGLFWFDNFILTRIQRYARIFGTGTMSIVYIFSWFITWCWIETKYCVLLSICYYRKRIKSSQILTWKMTKPLLIGRCWYNISLIICIRFAEWRDPDYIYVAPFRDKINKINGNHSLLFQMPQDIFSIWKGE